MECTNVTPTVSPSVNKRSPFAVKGNKCYVFLAAVGPSGVSGLHPVDESQEVWMLTI